MNGKGSAPRNCFSPQFRDNYDQIDWSKGRSEPQKTVPQLLAQDHSAKPVWFLPEVQQMLAQTGTGRGYYHE